MAAAKSSIIPVDKETIGRPLMSEMDIFDLLKDGKELKSLPQVLAMVIRV